MDMIMEGKWKDKFGFLLNPGKGIFLCLIVSTVLDASYQRDADGLTYARKSTIMTGMILNTNQIWEDFLPGPKFTAHSDEAPGVILRQMGYRECVSIISSFKVIG